jgi:hypothetical protein
MPFIFKPNFNSFGLLKNLFFELFNSVSQTSVHMSYIHEKSDKNNQVDWAISLNVQNLIAFNAKLFGYTVILPSINIIYCALSIINVYYFS